MRKLGIWLDKKNAKIISIEDGKTNLVTVDSNVESFRPKGGSGTKMKGGPQDVVQDSKFKEREKHQLRDYFKEIIAQLPDHESIVVFGPAETGEKFAKELSTNYKNIFNYLRGVKKADSMTENQMIAWVKDFYKP